MMSVTHICSAINPRFPSSIFPQRAAEYEVLILAQAWYLEGSIG